MYFENVMRVRQISLGLVLALTVAGCARGQEPTPTLPPAASAQADDLPPPVGLVDSTIIFTDCGTVANMNAKLAAKTMRQLVEACSEVPGGTAQFSATLLPGGRIELATPDGGVGMVPVCVLHHELKHKVIVQKPCTMQVRMSERR